MVQNISYYTFSASTKEITLTGVTVNIEKVRLIKNLTTNTFIYKFTDSLTISAIGSIITFTADNTGMLNTDKLVIQYDLDTSVDIQKTTITDGAGTVNTKQLGTALTSSDVGLVSQSVIHGLSSVGGGNYVDVKVNPSGALTVEATINGALPLPTGAATETTLAALNTKTPTLDAGKVPVKVDILQPLTDAELRATPVPITDNGVPLNIKNFNGRLRDAFQTFPNTNWTVPKQGAGDIIAIEGNAGGASYLSISLDPLTPNTETWVESVGRFKMPFDLAFGAHMSQRTIGQEVSMEFVSDEPIIPLFSDIQVASIQQTAATPLIPILLPTFKPCS
jgi:hypothetical protein